MEREVFDSPGGPQEDTPTLDTSSRTPTVIYTVEDTPPWYLCILLGFQHYLTAVGGLISVPLLLSPYFCMDEDYVGISELISTIFFVSGICTLLQTTIGVSKFCFFSCVFTGVPQENFTDYGLPEIGSDQHKDMWMARIREIQGAIMVASIFQVVIGFSGLMGLALRFIGPLAITPTISLIGLSLFDSGSGLASKHWWIALMTIGLIGLFSQYLRNVQIPCVTVVKGKGCTSQKMPFFSLFPVLTAIVLAWVICGILTATGALPDSPDEWGYEARTDISNVLAEAKWFRFPYPGQWGTPTVSTASVFGILAGVLASMIESVGDYYACARLAGAPPPPVTAINRGIGIEGIGCILAGAWGSGNGTTSYSENVGAIGITKVGSRRVVQVGGVVMLLLGCLGKFGALFTTIPGPVIGGVFMVTFGMVTAVGLSNLQYIDLNSSRNIFVLGLSMYFGLSMPVWLKENNDAIDTGSDIADQILTVLFSTSMFVGGLVGFVLDNTIPGTDEERGIHIWRVIEQSKSATTTTGQKSVYDLPLQKHLDKARLFRYIPFCPAFLRMRKRSTDNGGVDNLGNDAEDSNNVTIF